MKKVLYVFAHLEDADIDRLASIGRSERVEKGSALIREGEDLDAVFILLEGSFAVTAVGAGELSRLDWGEIIGEMSLVDGRAASATVTSIGPCDVLRVPRADLEREVRCNAGFAARFYRGISMTISERLRQTNAKLQGAAIEPSDELSEGLLDAVHLAGARFDRLVKAVGGHG